MDEEKLLAGQFEAHRAHLRAVAYRMLGSLSDADDAVQDAWMRFSRADTSEVDNLKAWLTTVVARVSLDLLRSRSSRREDPTGATVPDDAVRAAGVDPEQEALIADTVGSALLVVLDTLSPAERLAFVLHDLFGVPFDEVGGVLGRSPNAAKQLASRARHKVRGTDPAPGADPVRQREVVDAFLAASRHGDFGALLAVLDPDVVLHADPAAVPSGAPAVLHGARAVAYGARAASVRSRHSAVALIDGVPGIVYAPGGRAALVLAFSYRGDRISAIDVIADPDRLEALELAVPG